METDSKKTYLVKDWSIPKTVTKVRSFLGFMNYYQHFIHQYAQVVQPLYKLISGDNASKRWNM